MLARGGSVSLGRTFGEPEKLLTLPSPFAVGSASSASSTSCLRPLSPSHFSLAEGQTRAPTATSNRLSRQTSMSTEFAQTNAPDERTAVSSMEDHAEMAGETGVRSEKSASDSEAAPVAPPAIEYPEGGLQVSIFLVQNSKEGWGLLNGRGSVGLAVRPGLLPRPVCDVRIHQRVSHSLPRPSRATLAVAVPHIA